MWSLKLSKESFKFSGAHFTTFSQDKAEMLHGHNYYVSVSLDGCTELNHGLIVDLNEPKEIITSLLNSIDEKVLVAEQNPYTQINKTSENVTIKFNEKTYSFPISDCAFLNIENITIEALACFISKKLERLFSTYPISSYTVEVSESRGQACSYTQNLEEK